MSNLKKWVKHESSGGGSFVKFEKEGDSVEGLWEGIVGKSQKFNTPNGSIITEEGTKLVSCSTGLINQVEDIPAGTEIKIVYAGYKKNDSSGRDFKSFDVYINEEQEV